MKKKTIEEACNAESGDFKKFVLKKKAHIQAIESERKSRIRAARKANQELSMAA